MRTRNRYSLWLMPSGKIYTRLSSIISKLSRNYKTPDFEPHVTLLGGLMGAKEEIIGKTSNLTGHIKPYQLTLTKVDYLDEYFRCLFIKVKKTKLVIDANLEASNFFEYKQYQAYLPHLSLMYGNLPTEVKKEIITKIGKSFAISFKATSIHLFSTQGEPADWYRVKEFPLK